MEKTINEIEAFGRINGYPIIREKGAQVLVDLVKQNKPKKILEIGTAIGYSGSLMLTNCEGSLVTLELNAQSAEIARQNFAQLGLSDRVEVIVGDAKESLQKLTEKFDFIFLDGPKGQYINYLPVLKDLLNVGGLLVADNVHYHGLVLKEGVPEKKNRTIVNNLRKYLQSVTSDVTLKTEILPFADGIAISRKEL